MSNSTQLVQVLASSGENSQDPIPSELEAYAQAVQANGPTRVPVSGNPYVDSIALHTVFQLKVEGTGDLEDNVDLEPHAMSHQVQPADRAQWTPISSGLGTIYRVTGIGFLAIRTV